MLTVTPLFESVGDYMRAGLNKLDGPLGGYLRAGLTGLGGVYTGGYLSGGYDIYKKQAALQADALRRKDPMGMYNADQVGNGILYGIGGSIPVVGSITNIMAYRDRLKAEKQANLTGSWGQARKRTPEDDR